MFFSDETYTNNGDSCREAIITYGTNVLSPSSTEMTISSALASPSSYPSTVLGQSLMTIKRSVQISFNNMWYTNNWKIETDYGTRSQLAYID